MPYRGADGASGLQRVHSRDVDSTCRFHGAWTWRMSGNPGLGGRAILHISAPPTSGIGVADQRAVEHELGPEADLRTHHRAVASTFETVPRTISGCECRPRGASTGARSRIGLATGSLCLIEPQLPSEWPQPPARTAMRSAAAACAMILVEMRPIIETRSAGGCGSSSWASVTHSGLV